MFKDGLADSAVSILSESGFSTVECLGSRSSFDVIARRDEMLLLVKTLSNIEGLTRESVSELKVVSSLLGAIPMVVSQRMKSSELSDDVVYDRYGVCVCNLKTLGKIVNNAPPRVYSKRGNYCVHINPQMLSGARRRVGLTQDSLARKLGVTKQSIYRYESSGTVSLEVFERLKDLFGEGLAEPEFTLEWRGDAEPVTVASRVTSFKRKVCKEFEIIGFDTAFTNAPFDIVATSDDRVFSVVSNDWRRLEDKLKMLESISGIVGGYSLCISERKVRSEVSIMTPEELAEVKSPRDMFKLLSGK